MAGQQVRVAHGTSPPLAKQERHLQYDFQMITRFQKPADIPNMSALVFISTRLDNLKDPNIVVIPNL